MFNAFVLAMTSAYDSSTGVHWVTQRYKPAHVGHIKRRKIDFLVYCVALMRPISAMTGYQIYVYGRVLGLAVCTVHALAT